MKRLMVYLQKDVYCFQSSCTSTKWLHFSNTLFSNVYFLSGVVTLPLFFVSFHALKTLDKFRRHFFILFSDMHEHSSEHLLNTFKMIRLSLPFKCSPCLYVFHCSGRACCYLIHWELYWGWLLYTNCILRETERCRNCCQVLASCILTQTNSFLSSGFAKLRKVPINFVMSVCPHGTIDSYNMDIHEIWYLSIISKIFENIQV